MKYVFAIIASMIFVSQAKAAEWKVDSGELKYHVHFVLKEVTGVSKQVRGKGICKGETCQFLVASPVKAFDSGDSNRDLHMLEVTKGATFPLVSVKVSLSRQSMGSEQKGDVEVQFAGQSKKYSGVKITTETSGVSTKASGMLPIHLSDFQVERPSLLGMKIDDNVEIDFQLNLTESP